MACVVLHNILHRMQDDQGWLEGHIKHEAQAQADSDNDNDGES